MWQDNLSAEMKLGNAHTSVFCAVYSLAYPSDGQKLTKKLLTNSLTTSFKLDH